MIRILNKTIPKQKKHMGSENFGCKYYNNKQIIKLKKLNQQVYYCKITRHQKQRPQIFQKKKEGNKCFVKIKGAKSDQYQISQATPDAGK